MELNIYMSMHQWAKCLLVYSLDGKVYCFGILIKVILPDKYTNWSSTHDIN
jgi:hypothetical protein